MSRFFSAISLIMAFGLLSACTRYEVIVNGFQNVNETMPQQATYAIFQLENQRVDLEFQEYARMIEAKLQEKGYRKAEINSADIGVLINYGIDDGVTRHTARSVPVYGTTNYSGTAVGSGGTTFYSGQSSGIVGSRTHVDSDTEYKRVLTLEVMNLAKLRADGSVVPIWKGETTSRGSSSDLRRVMPYLIESTFLHFGQNTKLGIRHTIYEDEKTAKTAEKSRNVRP